MSFTLFRGVIGLALLLPGIAGAAHAAPQNTGQIAGKTPVHLSAQALRQIDALERDADARTPLQQKIDSNLLYAAKMARGEQIVPGISTLATAVNLNWEGLTLVDIDADVTPDVLQAILRSGGTIVYSSPRWNSIRASVPLSALETLALVPGVRAIKRPDFGYLQNPAPSFRPKKMDFLAPFVLPQRVSLSQRQANVRVHLPGLLARLNAGVEASSVGSVADEADKTHRADKARSTYHVDGTGIKIGVLSDSIENGNGIYTDAVNSGDVPPINVISGQSGGNATGEGLAMLEGIHDLAPGAQLYFATGNSTGGAAQFADNIVKLQQAGCKVIVDDVGYSNDPAFQDGTIAKAVNTVTAAGAMYFSSAGNDGSLKDSTASCWEGDFLDSGDTLNGGKVHLFDGVSETDDVSSNGAIVGVTMMWSDPLGKSSNDYDLFTFDSTGSTVRSSSTDRQTGSQDPIESVQAGDGDLIVAVLHKGSARYLRVAISGRGIHPFHYATPGSTVGHSAAPNTFCVAATPAADPQTYSNTGNPIPGSPTGPYPDPFNSSNNVEQFSSDGPRHQFYKPDGSAITSGNFLHTGGTIFGKPDFTAADGTSTSLTSDEVGTNPNTGDPEESFAPFFGTSCAAPHAAAIAALVLSYNPSLTRAQLSFILDKSCTDIEDSGFDINAGYGILDAYKALQGTPAPTSVTVSSLSFTPNPVTSGQTATGTVKLSGPAPSGGAAVDIKVNGSDLGTTPVTAGSSKTTFTLSFNVTASTNYTVSASYGGKTVSTMLTVNPAASAVTLSSLVLTPTSVTAGQTSSGKITLSDVAPSGGVTISLKSSDTSSATVPSSVTIAAGNKSISFTVTTKSVTSKKTPTITATLGSSVKTAVLTINPAAATVTVKSLSVSPTSVKGGSANSTGTVTLTAAAPSGGLAVSLKSSDTSAATVSSTLNIAAGATSAAFKITTKSVTSMKTVTLTATAGSTSKTATLTVTGSGSTVTASALSFDPNSISSNGITTGTLTLSGNAPSGGADVALSSGGSAIETVTVPAGKSSTTFLLFSGVVSSTVTDTIDAAYGGKTVSAALTVKATTVKPTKISLSPSTVSGGGSTTITVTLSTTAPKGGAVVEIFQGSTDLGYALVPGGQTSTAVSYAPAPVTKTTTYTEKGTYNGTSVTTTLTVKP